jgi:hypothetical protein
MTVTEVPSHFVNALNSVTNLYGYGCEVSLANSRLNSLFKSSVSAKGPTTASTRFFFGRGDPNDTEARYQYSPEMGWLIAKTERNGLNDTLSYSLCAVYLYTVWDHSLRPAIARAEGVAVETILHPAIGDLRLIRNAILHREHVLDGDLEFFSFFKRGDVVTLDADLFYEILKGVFSGICSLAESFGHKMHDWQFDKWLAQDDGSKP